MGPGSTLIIIPQSSPPPYSHVLSSTQFHQKSTFSTKHCLIFTISKRNQAVLLSFKKNQGLWEMGTGSTLIIIPQSRPPPYSHALSSTQIHQKSTFSTKHCHIFTFSKCNQSLLWFAKGDRTTGKCSMVTSELLSTFYFLFSTFYSLPSTFYYLLSTICLFTQK